ncbi:two-component system, chemotaxis family, sensor kinase CheA [Burkholderia multivorans]
MNLDQALQTFLVESRELLVDMEAALLRVADEDDASESINAIFRAAHTIKGSAGLFGIDTIVRFTHTVESVLENVRGGTIALTAPLIALLLACADHIAVLVDMVDAGVNVLDSQVDQSGQALISALSAYQPSHGGAATLTHEVDVQQQAVTRHSQDASGSDYWRISIQFGENVLRNGMDPLSFIRYLSTLGTIKQIVTLSDRLPPLDGLDAEACYLGFDIAFLSDADLATIENVFEFVQDDCVLDIVPPHRPAPERIDAIGRPPEDSSRLAEMPVRCGTLEANAIEDASRIPAEVAPPRPIGDSMEEGNSVPGAAGPTSAKTTPTRERKSQEHQSVRVDADKLDRLIDLVGELITATASANVIARRSHNAELLESTSTLVDLVAEVRDSALQLRMVKIGATFGRFQRVVHDVARELGKDIALRASGEDTELDKTVVEKIGDPLLHLVRNAIDHGIEAPDVRMARGKSVRGTVSLNAYHDSGSIVIEIGDDGGGLDRDKILAKGIERGLVEHGKQLSDAEIFALIFEPGFSTADQVTNLSGRGVGMDVVKRNIAALRGTISLASRPGYGTTFTVRLPLTLAIIDGFLVGVGKSVFVVPLDVVDECITYCPALEHDYTDLRGQVLPFIRLHELFESSEPAAARQNIVVVKHGDEKFGLLVDTLMGEAQTVIKPLSKMFSRVEGISGSTILGSGEVALILDVPALFQQTQRSAGESPSAEDHSPNDRVFAL